VKKEEIHLWDIERILLGQAPVAFLLEVFIRSVIVYVIAIMVVRWMGKRMNGQHSIIELSVMVMMGAIISLPMQAPDRGILQGVLVLLITLFLLRSINWLGFKSVSVEKLVHGKTAVLVKDGVLQRNALAATKITNQNVFEILRSKKIFNLGKVKRLYLEGYGIFSVYTYEEDRPGLPTYPQIDEKIYEGHERISQNEKACKQCGQVQGSEKKQCFHCGSQEWTKAII
jgi:uncharacterized membrane protein YcaP (DUF421 family)